MRSGAAAIVLGLTVALCPVSARAEVRSEPGEYCAAVNPGQPTCSFVLTRDANTPVSGAAGIGDWKVTIKRGKSKIVLLSPSGGEPTAVDEVLYSGDKVRVQALAQGTSVIAGSLNTP